MTVHNVLLMIADIGGYTRFMRANRTSLAHAQLIVSQLLEAVIGAAPSWTVAKLEGDAIFFYRREDEGKAALSLDGELGGIHGAYLRNRARLIQERACTCEACLQLELLTLKFVAHRGTAAFQKINRSLELAGVDVILVHRMLKNEVPLTEYVLVTDEARPLFSSELGSQLLSLHHDFEGLGSTSTHYLDASRLPVAVEAPRALPRWKKWLGKIWFELKMLPFWLGFRRTLSR